MQEHADYAEALRLIRKHMQPGDTLGMMFMRVAKELERPHLCSEAECPYNGKPSTTSCKCHSTTLTPADRAEAK
jgi:hypothetical protein